LTQRIASKWGASQRVIPLYSGEIPLAQVAEAFSKRPKKADLENMEMKLRLKRR